MYHVTTPLADRWREYVLFGGAGLGLYKVFVELYGTTLDSRLRLYARMRTIRSVQYSKRCCLEIAFKKSAAALWAPIDLRAYGVPQHQKYTILGR
eukprot:214516-Prymnesium_polylepis.1